MQHCTKTSFRRERVSWPSLGRRHAVVVGGSLAGMLAARVLSDHFDRVTLLERDRFPETPAARRGCRRAGTCTACWNAAAGPWSGSSRA